jgi:hypothetical protein
LLIERGLDSSGAGSRLGFFLSQIESGNGANSLLKALSCAQAKLPDFPVTTCQRVAIVKSMCDKDHRWLHMRLRRPQQREARRKGQNP